MGDRAAEPALTDRYVWAVTRHLGPETGPDVARELRGSIHDTIEAKVGAGADPARAEEEALTELGDPDALAREYGEVPGYLIGPAVYPGYVRLLKVLLAVLVPLALALVFVDRFAVGAEGFGDIALEMVGAVIAVTVHVCFWVTLAFALIDRARPAHARGEPLAPWRTDQLPAGTPWRQVRLPGTIAYVLFVALVIALLIWQFAGVTDPTMQVQILNPDLALTWVALLIGALVAEIVLAVAVWRAGRWTPPLAVGYVLANATWALVAVWLLLQDQLIVPDLPERFGAVFGVAADWTVPTSLIAAGVLLIAVWEIVDCLRNIRQAATRQASTRP